MPTDLPTAAREAVRAERLADGVAMLVTITDTTLPAPLRYTDWPATRISIEPLRYGLNSLGETFVHALRGAALPNETEGSAPATQIAIDNVVEDAKPALAALSADARVSLALVLGSQPDTRFATVTGLRIVDRAYRMETVTITVAREEDRAGAADRRAPAVAERQTRVKAPGLHR